MGRRKNRPRRWLRKAVLAAVAGIAAWLVIEIATWPKVADLAATNPPTTAFIERYRQECISAGTPPQVVWQPVPYSRISPHLKRAVLVSEDINFFSHNGFETSELSIAVREAMAEKRMPRGASTISQQLVKNLWLSPARNPIRKLEEALLTVHLEHRLDKQRILELYLNLIELGPGIYGAEAGSRHYFGRSAADLSPRQAAGLAASLPRPSSWHPGCSSPSYDRRVELILKRMERAQFLWKVI